MGARERGTASASHFFVQFRYVHVACLLLRVCVFYSVRICVLCAYIFRLFFATCSFCQ